jgi:hypothetical protein
MIVSDLALLVQDQRARSDKAYTHHLQNFFRQLSSFDHLSSREAFVVFAGLGRRNRFGEGVFR